MAVTAAALAADLGDDVEVLGIDVDPGLPDAFLALAMVLVGQLLALESAERLGLDPDVPIPGGEVNRVVRDVRIHPLETAAT